MPDTQDPATLSTASSDAPREAREQAKEYGSVFAPNPLTLDDGTEIPVPPHPNLRMLDDEPLAAYEELELRLESFDRLPNVDVPEQNVYDNNSNLSMTMPPSTQPGQLKVPYRRTDPETGEVVDKLDAPYQVMVAKIALGERDYARLKAGKINGHSGQARHVWGIWNQQGQDAIDRQNQDSKSDGSAVDGAPVPPADTP